LDQLELFKIKSPCIGVCQAADNGFCKGCFRSRDERQQWLYFSEEQKKAALKKAAARKKRALKVVKPVKSDPLEDLFKL